MKKTSHSPWLDECFKRVKRRRFIDSAGCQSMMCEAKVHCAGHEYYMAILDSDIPGYRIGHSSVIDRGEEGFESDDGIVARCYGLDAYLEYVDTDFPDIFEALYHKMDEDDDSVIFKRSGDIVIGEYAIASKNDCWWAYNVVRILDALIDSWGTALPFAVATSTEGPDMFVFCGSWPGDVMHVIEGTRNMKAQATNIKFEDFRDGFMLGLKRFVRHPSRKSEGEWEEYTEQLRRKLKRKINAYERAKEQHDNDMKWLEKFSENESK